jgi:hypothetical protein
MRVERAEVVVDDLLAEDRGGGARTAPIERPLVDHDERASQIDHGEHRTMMFVIVKGEAMIVVIWRYVSG